MAPRYRVTLTVEERSELKALTRAVQDHRQAVPVLAGSVVVRPPREVIFDGVFEARLVALACSQAPPGRKRWALRLLAEKVV